MPKKASDVFRKNLRSIIDAQEMTITEVAEKVGTSRPSISFILSGDEGVSLDRAERIAKAVGYNLSELLSKDFKKKLHQPA